MSMQVRKLKKELGEDRQEAQQALADAQKEDYEDFDDYMEMSIQARSHPLPHPGFISSTLVCSATVSAQLFAAPRRCGSRLEDVPMHAFRSTRGGGPGV